MTFPTCDPSREGCCDQTPCDRCPLREPVEGQADLFGEAS